MDVPLHLFATISPKVIEISSIPEHLLGECQNSASYTECEISLLAIRVEELAKWQRSMSCKPPGKGKLRDGSGVAPYLCPAPLLRV